MAGSFSRKIRIWSEIRASCQCNVRTFFLKVFATFCHIQRNQRVGRFADRTGAESKSLVLLKWIVLFRAFMMFQEKWADMNLWVCLRITQLAFESKIWITLSFQDLTCFFDYKKYERTRSAFFSKGWFPIWMLPCRISCHQFLFAGPLSGDHRCVHDVQPSLVCESSLLLKNKKTHQVCCSCSPPWGPLRFE